MYGEWKDRIKMAAGTLCASAGSSKDYKLNRYSCNSECLCYPVMKRGILKPTKEVATLTNAEMSRTGECVAATNLGVMNSDL